MPIKTITPEQALKRIADECALRKIDTNIAAAIVAESFKHPDPQLGPNVIVPRRVLEALASAMTEIADATDCKINIG